ncbi:hypothetical protein GOODEAATRI_021062, partial [Goodea atripinnis]
PKRCPTENYSTAFGHLMPREEHLLQRPEGQVDRRRHSFHSSSPRKRLQFPSTEDKDDKYRFFYSFFSDRQVPEPSGHLEPLDRIPQLGWEEHRDCSGPDQQDSSEDLGRLSLDRPQSLAEAERLFDELTQEKLQVCLRVCE